MVKHDKNTRHTAKLRLLAAARDGHDWRAIATTREINIRTAANWVSAAHATNEWEPPQGEWEGFRYRRMREEFVDHLEGLLSANLLTTLLEMSASIGATFYLHVSPQTFKNALDGRFYSLKKVHYEPNYMNRMENKTKRRDYLRQLIELTADGKVVFYLDETKFNVWCSRQYGRSKIGQRAASVRSVSQGENMHVIACISKGGLEYYECRFGSLKKVDCHEVVTRVLQRLNETYTLSDVMLVLDNAPCHRGLEEVFGESLKVPPSSGLVHTRQC